MKRYFLLEIIIDNHFYRPPGPAPVNMFTRSTHAIMAEISLISRENVGLITILTPTEQ
jgi:hypothetical protein